MNNLISNAKKILANKNAVTVVCILAGILVLYLGYMWRVNVAIKPTTIPYAKATLSSRHVITNDDIGYMEVSQAVLNKSPNIIRNSGQLLGKEILYGSSIPQNSFFYSENVVESSNQPINAIENTPDDFTLFSLPVDIHTTYGNSMYPGNYIDLWIKANDDNRKIIYTTLIRSIKILDVRDSSDRSVFETASENRTPSSLLFAVPDSMYSLLRKAQYINGVSIIPVPRNKAYTSNPGDTVVASEYIRNFILSKAAVIPDEQLNNDTTIDNSNNDITTETFDNSNTSDNNNNE